MGIDIDDSREYFMISFDLNIEDRFDKYWLYWNCWLKDDPRTNLWISIGTMLGDIL